MVVTGKTEMLEASEREREKERKRKEEERKGHFRYFIGVRLLSSFPAWFLDKLLELLRFTIAL